MRGWMARIGTAGRRWPGWALAALLAAGAPAAARAGSLYDDLGAEAGVRRIVDGMVERALADPRIAFAFDNTNHDRLRGLIAQQFCHLAGGPCAARPRGMGPAHTHLGLRERHFLALVEDLQDSMDAAGVPFRTQNRLLALLAPMKREIVRE